MQTIKVADLIDNTKSIVPHDKDFAKVYLAEKDVLLQSLTDADVELWATAYKQLLAAQRLVNG